MTAPKCWGAAGGGRKGMVRAAARAVEVARRAVGKPGASAGFWRVRQLRAHEALVRANGLCTDCVVEFVAEAGKSKGKSCRLKLEVRPDRDGRLDWRVYINAEPFNGKVKLVYAPLACRKTLARGAGTATTISSRSHRSLKLCAR